jgi:hypothetical protein
MGGVVVEDDVDELAGRDRRETPLVRRSAAMRV